MTTPPPNDVPAIEAAQLERLRALAKSKEPLLPTGTVTECPDCHGEMATTKPLERIIPTPSGLLVLARLPVAECLRCRTRQFDAAALRIIAEHSTSEIHADYETRVTHTSGKTLEPMRFQVTLERAREGGFTAACVEIPGAISEGETVEEALANVSDAIREILEVPRRRAQSNARAHKVLLETVEGDAEPRRGGISATKPAKGAAGGKPRLPARFGMAKVRSSGFELRRDRVRED